MPEQDGNNHQERVLSGETIETKDQQAIAKVRSDLLAHARMRKGLPPIPVQLDVQAISQLTDADTIDSTPSLEEPTQKTAEIIDISKRGFNESVVGYTIQAERSKKKAA